MSKSTPGPWKASFENCGGARLIAAAPELLEALKHLVHWHDQLSKADIVKAEAVIARAVGLDTSVGDAQ